MSDVFISHSSKDKGIADQVCKFMEDKGLTCWIAPRDIVPGTDWAASITTAITASHVFLLIYSANSAASDQVARELSLAETKKNVYIVPYKVDDTELSGSYEYYLIGAHWITANYNKGDYKLEELYNNIAGILGKGIQNITNNTYIDHLHIENGADLNKSIQDAVKAQAPAASQAPGYAPMPSPVPVQPPAAKSKKPLIIGLSCAAAAVVAAAAIIIVMSGNNDSKTVSTADSSVSAVSSAAETPISSAADTPASSAADVSEAPSGQGVELTNVEMLYHKDKYTGTYKGEVNENNVPDGQGEYSGTSTDKDGKEWKIECKGGFIGGKLNGKNTVHIVNPKGFDYTVECDFNNGYENGEGKLTANASENLDATYSEKIYEGSFKDGNFDDEDGVQVITFKSSADNEIATKTYTGQFSDNTWNGKGKLEIKYIESSKYLEEAVESTGWKNGALNGQGKEELKFKNGDIKTYEGEYKDGKWNGSGSCKLTYANGEYEISSGTYKENKLVSGETVTFDKDGNELSKKTVGDDSSQGDDSSKSSDPDKKGNEISLAYMKDIYTGTYKGEVNSNKLPEGKGEFTGTLKGQDGEWKMTCKGEFKDAKMNGKCTVTIENASGDIFTYDCVFQDGYQEGKGKLTKEFNPGSDSEYTKLTYEGGFKNGEWSDTKAVETYYYKDGDKNGRLTKTYTGGFEKNSWKGTGTCVTVYGEGSKYKKFTTTSSEWEAGQVNGKGKETLEYANGDVRTYEGDYIAGIWAGEGVVTSIYANGEKVVETGTFANGSMISGETVKYDKDGKEVSRDKK